jgi:choline dehydrogenase-like flavoprotein
VPAQVEARQAELTAAERRLQKAVGFFTFVFIALVVGYLLQGAFNEEAAFPFVANSVAKDGMMAVLCALAWADVRRNGWAVTVVVGAHLLIIGSLLFMLALNLVFGNSLSVAGAFEGPLGTELPDPEILLVVWFVLAVAVVVVLAVLRNRALRAQLSLLYLWPHQYQAATALAEVLVVGPDERLTPDEVGTNVDQYLNSFSATGKSKLRLALSALCVYPILRGRPPFTLMSAERRQRFVEQRFIADVAERRLPAPIRRLVQSILVAVQQLTFIGYYADPRAAADAGYVPFSKRPRYAAAVAGLAAERSPLDVHTPREVDGERLTADVAIVGSGAAGAMLAYRLAKRGREVVVLERGKHVDPSQFTEDERGQFSDLYSDGAMQLSGDARFQVLQGMCVGGSTVVNNAVCFDLPDHMLDRWNDRDGLDAGLDEAALRKSFKRVRKWLPVISQAGNRHLGAGGDKLVEGIERLGLADGPGECDVVEANIADDCFGCGYCNIGCRFGKKLSALDVTLPRAQQRFGTDALRIYSECEVERVSGANGGSAALECRLSDGRPLRVAANTVVISAGALASSLILQRSDLGGPLAGSALSCNLGAPMTGEFAEKLDSYDGLQISHYLKPANEDGLVLQSWFNPVGAQSLFMPGWFSDHYRNMRRYDHMATAGSVVGTRSNIRVRAGRRGRGMRLDYEPAADDLQRLLAGLELIGRIFLAADAERVMPPTFSYMPIDDEAELSSIGRRVRDNTDITLHTSHPQGGNPISRDPSKGVVDENFAVRGASGVHVCDASVFPSAATVSPQLTVMALADYASARID